MGDILRGAKLMMGGLAALLVLGALGTGGYLGYRYISTDWERVALVEEVVKACANGRGEFRHPQVDENSISSMAAGLANIKAQQKEIAGCSVARTRLMSYDLGLEL